MSRTVLTIDGMTCGNCVRHVGDALRALPGVTGADVQLASRSATVDHDPALAPVAALTAAIEAEGYVVVAAPTPSSAPAPAQ